MRRYGEISACCDWGKGIGMRALPIILVVEDEPFVRMEIVSRLQDAGFDTLESGSASEAIDVLSSRLDIKIVFTDIEMPGTMDGLALSHFVRDRWPPTIIVVSSGRKRPGSAELPSDATFISKPHCTNEFAAVLKSVKGQFANL